MALQVIMPGRFTSENVGLQGNLVKITFPLATDKNSVDPNKETITYQVRYSSRPIYCSGTSSTEYIYTDTNDRLSYSGWTTITNLIKTADNTGTTITTLPVFPTDRVLKYEIVAVINYEGQLYSYIKSSDFFAITNEPADISPIVIDWGENSSIRLMGKINHVGFSTPANYLSDALREGKSATAFKTWRTDLVSVFGDIEFNYTFYWGDDSNTPNGSVNTNTQYNFRLSTLDWIYNNKIDITIDNPTTSSGLLYNPDKSYYFKFYLNKKGISTTSNSVLNMDRKAGVEAILLLNIIPLFQILKTGIKVNIPKANKTKAGGAIVARSALQMIDNDINTSSSLALYDYYVPIGENTPLENPSVGFYKTDNSILGKIEVTTYEDAQFGTTNIISLKNFNQLLGITDISFTTDVSKKILFRYLPDTKDKIRLLDHLSVIDNLTTVNNILPLSAKQGKILKDLVDSKVSSVTGKGLSTNDFTDALLTKLNNIPPSVYSKIESDDRYISKVLTTTTDANATYNSGFYSTRLNNGTPTNAGICGSLIACRGDANHDNSTNKTDSSQIYIDNQNQMFFRTSIDYSNGAWAPWKEVAVKPQVYEYSDGSLYLRREGRVVTGHILSGAYTSGDSLIANRIPKKFKPQVGGFQTSLVINHSSTIINFWSIEMFYGDNKCYLTLTSFSAESLDDNNRSGWYLFNGRRSGTLQHNITFSYVCIESES